MCKASGPRGAHGGRQHFGSTGYVTARATGGVGLSGWHVRQVLLRDGRCVRMRNVLEESRLVTESEFDSKLSRPRQPPSHLRASHAIVRCKAKRRRQGTGAGSRVKELRAESSYDVGLWLLGLVNSHTLNR